MAIQDDVRPALPIVFMGNGDAAIELIESKDNSFKGSGISLGYHVGDIDEKRKSLAELGYEPTEMISPKPGVKFFFLADPDGVQIQFI